jgi:hypothetical protein
MRVKRGNSGSSLTVFSILINNQGCAIKVLTNQDPNQSVRYTTGSRLPLWEQEVLRVENCMTLDLVAYE